MAKVKRKSLSKSLRFEIFKRDGFRCHYCGVTPDRALLRVDHVEPVAKGGSDDPHNLITACHDCNAGKSATPLSDRKLAPTMSADDVREHAAQIKGYLAAQRELTSAKKEILADFEAHWEDVVGWEMTPTERASARKFLSRLPMQFVLDAVYIAAGKVPATTAYRSGQTFLYFCGICWKQIKSAHQEEPTPEKPTTAAPPSAPCFCCRQPVTEADGCMVIADVEVTSDGNYGARTAYPGHGQDKVSEDVWWDWRREVFAAHAECTSASVGYGFSLDRLGEDWERHLLFKFWWHQKIDKNLDLFRRHYGFSKAEVA